MMLNARVDRRSYANKKLVAEVIVSAFGGLVKPRVRGIPNTEVAWNLPWIA